MKFTTTSAAIAVAATGAAAQDSWSAWASTSTAKTPDATKDCSTSTVTAYKTETATVYEHTSEVFKATVTVPYVEESTTTEVSTTWSEWQSTSADPTTTTTQTWSEWESTSAAATSTTTKAKPVCKDAETVTSTATVYSTKAGTTTVTHSTLFVAAQVTGSAEEAWANWNPDKGSDSDTSSGNGNIWNGNGLSGNDDNDNDWSSGSSDNNNNNNWNSGSSDNTDYNNNDWNSGDSVDTDSANDGTNGNNGWGKGSWGGKGNGGKIVGEGLEIFNWDPEIATVTLTGSAPEYTKNSDGSYSGEPFGGNRGWEDWNGDGSDGDDTNSGKGGKGNGTTPDNGSKGNGTYPPFGDPASNVTKPFNQFDGGFGYGNGNGNGNHGGYQGGFQGRCNDASDRSKWCDSKDVDSDYYEDYFTNRKCEYDLVLSRGTWNADGKDNDMLLVNGQFPGPAIECAWGDTVVINVHNQLDNNGTAIHWHGVRQMGTNDQDGVPGVTECALAPGDSRTYTWKASSYGTSWYHSHWNLQYGDGVQGPIIIHGPATADYDFEAGPVMITETYDANGQSASAFGSLIAHGGPRPTYNYLLNGKNVAPDLSSGQHALWKVQKGKKYLFRLINSAAQNMWSVSIDQHKFTVIAADFVPIVPYTTDWLNIAIGQRYDVIVEANQDVGSYFFRAVAQLGCPGNSTNTGLAQANGIIAYEGVSETPLALPVSNINGNKTLPDFAICADEPLASLVPHVPKTAGTKDSFSAAASTLPVGRPVAVQTNDDGNVFRWSLNNGALYVNYTQPTLKSLSDGAALNSSVYGNPIVLNQKGKWYYFVIQNQFFASHPMHLHGHDFSLLGQGFGDFSQVSADVLNFDNPMRRDTAMLRGAPPGPPGPTGWTVIGFETDNPGAWLMHCHIAWHVDGGLALQWLERPDDIGASGYTSKSTFSEECTAYGVYEAANPANKKTSGQSGLKKRTSNYFDKLVLDAERRSVVRRDDLAAHYLAGHQKRNLGDGANRRSLVRRSL